MEPVWACGVSAPLEGLPAVRFSVLRAGGRDTHFHVVEGANHMSFYDAPQYVEEAVSVLAPFFPRTLNHWERD